MPGLETSLTEAEIQTLASQLKQASADDITRVLTEAELPGEVKRAIRIWADKGSGDREPIQFFDLLTLLAAQHGDGRLPQILRARHPGHLANPG